MMMVVVVVVVVVVCCRCTQVLLSDHSTELTAVKTVNAAGQRTVRAAVVAM